MADKYCSVFQEGNPNLYVRALSLAYFYSSCPCFYLLFFSPVYSNFFPHIIYSSAVQQNFLCWLKYSIISVQYCNHKPHMAIEFWSVVKCDWGTDFFSFLAAPCRLWNLSSPARDRTHPPQWKCGVLTTGPPGESLRNTVFNLELNSTCGQWHCIRQQGSKPILGVLAQLLVTLLLDWIFPLACCFLSPAGVVLFT